MLRTVMYRLNSRRSTLVASATCLGDTLMSKRSFFRGNPQLNEKFSDISKLEDIEVATVDAENGELGELFDIIEGRRSLDLSSLSSKMAIKVDTPKEDFFILPKAWMSASQKAAVSSSGNNKRAKKVKEEPKKLTKSRKTKHIGEDVGKDIKEKLAQEPNYELFSSLMERVDEESKLLDSIEQPSSKQYVDNDQQFVESFDNLNPRVHSLSKKSHSQLHKRMNSHFTVRNLKAYLRFKGVKVRPKSVKADMIDSVIKDVWSISVDTDKPDYSMGLKNDNPMQTKILEVSDKVIAVLLGREGRNLFEYAKNGVNLMYGSSDGNHKILVQATESNMIWFEADVSNKLRNLKAKLLDLDSLSSIEPNMPLILLSKLTSTFLEKIKENVYILHADSTKGMLKMKRLLVWLLDYNSRKTTWFANAGSFLNGDFKFFEYQNNLALPLVHRADKWFRIRSASRNNKSETQLKDPKSTFTDSEIEEMFNKLEYDPSENSVVSATFGQALFKESFKDSMDVSLLEKPASKVYTFSSQVPLVKRKAYSLKLYEEFSSDIPEDQHSYYVYLRLTPSPFKEHDKQIISSTENYVKYPEIEVWIEIDSHQQIQWNTLSVVSIEKENSVIVNMPDNVCDLQLTNTVTNTLISLVNEHNFDKEQLDSYFEGQSELLDFLRRCNFDPKKPTDLPPTTNIMMGDEEVQYMFVSAWYRKQLNLKTENGRLVLMSSVLGGSTGGRREEIAMVNQHLGTQEKFSAHEFHKLFTEAINFVNK